LYRLFELLLSLHQGLPALSSLFLLGVELLQPLGATRELTLHLLALALDVLLAFAQFFCSGHSSSFT
jgi:hypothetical protein